MPSQSPISKSQYTKGVTCPKKLWLYRERKYLAAPPSPVQEAIFTQGHEVGRMAHMLFPGGVLIEQDHTDPEGAVKATDQAIQNGAPAIFEAAIRHDDLLIRADIIARNGDGTWDLIEVKSSTKVKPEHLPDVAIQKFVISGAGLKLRRSCLLHLNSQFVRSGDTIPSNELFILVPVDEQIADEYAEVAGNLLNFRELIKRSSMPKAPLKSACKNPYPCEFKNYCWSEVVEGSIHYLGRITDPKRNRLLGRGIDLIEKIPEDFELTDAQVIEAECARSDKVHIELTKIREFLDQLKWPIYFLDFETIGYAIPEYLGTRPYEALSFQYSLHIQSKLGAELEHKEFLFDRREDPRPELAQRLVADIGSEGSVVAFHASFERSRIQEMAAMLPPLASRLQNIAGRLWDLETPFAKRWYWDRRFQGSSSIKKVLPILVSGMSYKNLAVQSGDEAQLRYAEFLALPETSAQRLTLETALLEYCGQDSVAMAAVLVALQNEIKMHSID